MANWDFERIRDIMRRVIARRNETDVLSRNDELQKYIGEFLRDLMPQETKTFENFGTYSFNTIADQETYTFNTGAGASIDEFVYENVGPIAYSDEQLMRWYQDPSIFFGHWGFDTDVTTVQTGQPTDILLHGDSFTLKPRPDDVYTIRIFGYKRNSDETEADSSDELQAPTSNPVVENQWGRYVAYGASLDYMYDFGYDAGRIQVVESRYKHYKALVQNRTLNQFMQNTPTPKW